MRFVDHVVYVRMKLRLDGGPRLEDPHTAVNEAAALVAFYNLQSQRHLAICRSSFARHSPDGVVAVLAETESSFKKEVCVAVVVLSTNF